MERTEHQKQLRREQQRRYQEKYFKGVRLDGKAARVESRPSEPKRVSGRINDGLGSSTMAAIRGAVGTLNCGNCHKPQRDGHGELSYNKGCDQYLCPQCQQKYRRAIGSLAVYVRVERMLNLSGMIVPGTLVPAENAPR